MSGSLDYDLDIEAYHANPAISKTGLDRINRSPAHYYALTLDPNRPPEKERAGQLEGNLAHCAILEPDEFDKRYSVGPNVSRATKSWKEFVADLPEGVVGIKPDQYDTAMRQAESVRKIPDVKEALSKGHSEVSAFWNDPVTGVACRCRPDFVHPVSDSSVILLDVKTFSSADPQEFFWQVKRKRYDVQDAFYTHGYELAANVDVLAFIFVVVETEYPYAASAMMLDDVKKMEGQVAYRRNLDTYARCLKDNEWPSYSSAIELI